MRILPQLKTRKTRMDAANTDGEESRKPLNGVRHVMTTGPPPFTGEEAVEAVETSESQ